MGAKAIEESTLKIFFEKEIALFLSYLNNLKKNSDRKYLERTAGILNQSPRSPNQ